MLYLRGDVLGTAEQQEGEGNSRQGYADAKPGPHPAQMRYQAGML